MDLFAVPVHAAIKFLIVFMVTMALTLASYQVMVRHTFLGHWLHGRRDRARSILPASPNIRLRLTLRSTAAQRASAMKGPRS